MNIDKILKAISEIKIITDEEHDAKIHKEIASGMLLGKISPTYTRIVFSDSEEVSHTLTLPGFYPGLASIDYLLKKGIDFKQVKETTFVQVNPPTPPRLINHQPTNHE